MQAGPLQAFALGSIVLFSIVGTLMGLRLLLLARRTREIPELALGLCLVMIATVGYPLSIVSALHQDAGAGVRLALYLLTAGTVDVGIVAVLIFTRKVFRPEAGLASAGVWLGALSLALIVLLNSRVLLASPDAEVFAERARGLGVLGFGIYSSAFVWTALESLAWWRRLTRRAALGLADPVVANRFGLWALWGAGMAAGSTVNGVCMALGLTIHHPVPLLFAALCGLANSAILFLAFFAPSGYLAWLERRSGPASA